DLVSLAGRIGDLGRALSTTVLSRKTTSSRWKSRRLRLRSKPAYNIETGLLSIAPSREAGACHRGGPSSWHSLPCARRGSRSQPTVGLFVPVLRRRDLQAVATGCNHGAP